jgi:hypothetical protein
MAPSALSFYLTAFSLLLLFVEDQRRVHRPARALAVTNNCQDFAVAGQTEFVVRRELKFLAIAAAGADRRQLQRLAVA